MKISSLTRSSPSSGSESYDLVEPLAPVAACFLATFDISKSPLAKLALPLLASERSLLVIFVTSFSVESMAD